MFLTTSIRQSVPGEESEWSRCRKAVCHEGFEESYNCTKGKDCWTHTYRAASAGAHPPVSIPRHTSLCLPDGYQAAPYSWWGYFSLALVVLFLHQQIKWLMIICNTTKEADFSRCVNMYYFGWNMVYIISFVTDYVNGGELFTHLVQRVRFKEQEVALYSGEIVLALEHLHKVTPRFNTISLFVCCCLRALSLTRHGRSVIFSGAAWNRLSRPETWEYPTGFKWSYSSHRFWPQ